MNKAINSFPGSESGVSTTLPVGLYSVDEEYALSDGLPQVPGNDVKHESEFSTECKGTIEAGQKITCIITNTLVYTAKPATLIVTKIVTCQDDNIFTDCEDVDSNFEPQDFMITVADKDQDSTTFGGSSSGTVVTLEPGSYSVTEDFSGVGKIVTVDDIGNRLRSPITIFVNSPAITLSGDCSGTIAAGETKTCTITNPVILSP
ncbi:hypothetical protein NMY3_03050 [Candidatus Nitrosocosmicus oleophilus]|uniref:Uncharacterized protein n=1 Tax=Candidatus Nitrosocosmicus oleophilus TaxID=1353260 RepID=A0A654M225_9ARCH|nr:hypothetical protein [Candidatus Nitrosocosmicus oleophilus]ALI37237.1 hypothetical protein NMY3_03050 [Candidatus Nitrosocosmicus oleophilus]